MLLGMGRSPLGGTRGGQGQGHRDRVQPRVARGLGAARESWRAGTPLPLPAEGVDRVSVVDLEKGTHTASGWGGATCSPKDLQQEAPREGAEGAAGPSIWSQGPRLWQPGPPARLGWGLPGQHHHLWLPGPRAHWELATMFLCYICVGRLCLLPVVQGLEKSRT